MSIESRIAAAKELIRKRDEIDQGACGAFRGGHAEEAEMLNMRKHGTHRAHMPAEVFGDAKA
jgi:hypothetical protein